VVEPAREVGDTGAPLTTTDEEDVAKGAAVGALAGLAAGLLALTVPGIGLVLAAGPLALAVAGGAIAGGVYGGLRDIGIDDHRARGYEARIRGGAVLMTALIPDIDEGRVRDILREYNAEDISFVDDTSTMATGYAAADAAIPASPVSYPVGGAVTTPPASPAPYPADRAVTAPSVDMTGAASSVAPPTPPAAVIETTTVASYEMDIARGQAQQAEVRVRDRMVEGTATPPEDVAAVGERAADRSHEEVGEEEEEVVPPRI
jgi:hypothetical protein